LSDPNRLFGTDGIRAPFGRSPLDEATVTTLGRVLAEHLTEQSAAGNRERPKVVLGGDTRESTPTLARWLARGLAAGGAEAHHAGVIPTAGVAWLVRDLGTAAGIVISASHNPYPDNGIKLLDADGFKYSTEDEGSLERQLLEVLHGADAGAPEDGGSGEKSLGQAEPELVDRYLARLAQSLPTAGDVPRPLSGLRIVLDTGNGAASPHAGALFERLGAETEVIHALPDGTNVNRECGSTDTRDLARRVVSGGYHLGAAFDGDADRVILVDDAGRERDGDAILYLWASALDAAGELTRRSIVATSMSNLGLERALDRRGIGIIRCGVGDREVVETMRREGIVLGGEQSGHIVHLGLTTTGDGLLTALQIAALAARRVREDDTERPLAVLLDGFRRYPQVLLNVRVREKPDLATVPEVDRVVCEVEERLGGDGRLVLRYSGTEPLARVMIEGRNQEEIDELAARIAAAIEDILGLRRTPDRLQLEETHS